MKTNYEFIYFEKTERKPKTSVWACVSRRSGDEIGNVRWYGPWRQYSFFPANQTVFNRGCLLDILDFLKQLKEGKNG